MTITRSSDPRPSAAWRRQGLLAATAVIGGLVLCAAIGSSAQAVTPVGSAVVPPSTSEDVALIADPALRGRLAGSPEAAFAARYIAMRLRTLGLQPGFGERYLQPVPLVRIDCDRSQSLVRIESEPPLELRHGQGLYLELSGEPIAADAPHTAVFAGYGISAPEAGHDELAGLELSSHAVLIWNGEPKTAEGNSPFAPGKMSRFSFIATKRDQLARRGAALIVVLTPPGGPSALDAYRRVQQQKERPQLVLAGTPAAPLTIYLDEATTRTLLQAAGTSADELWRQTGLGKNPARPLAALRLSAHLASLRIEPVEEHNVLAILPGSDPALRHELLIVGSHFDHVGTERGPDGTTTIYPGADDNASGIAAMLAIAHRMVTLPESPAAGRDATTTLTRPRRSLLFASFAAEESGALGSSWLAAHLPPSPAGQPSWSFSGIVNLDMVGQNHLGRADYAGVVLASYTARAPQLTAALIAASAATGLEVRKIPYVRPSGRSDDAPFAERKLPAMLLFTGMHPDHDTPRDTAESLVAGKIDRVAAFAAQLVLDLANAQQLSWDETISQAPPADPWDRPY